MDRKPVIRKFVQEENDKIVRCEEFTTVRKLRFVEPYKDGVELNKLFSVNYINEAEISDSAEQKSPGLLWLHDQLTSTS